MDSPAGAAASTAGAKKAAGEFAYHVFGAHPNRTMGFFIALIVVLLIFIVAFIVSLSKYNDCVGGGKGSMLGTDPLGNLNTGSNNPMWYKQMGDAGWGGSMHSTYQHGQPRVWGASAEGGHDMAVVPVDVKQCGGRVSPAAIGEAQALTGVQALDPSSSAKNMSDDALMRVMNGGA